MRMRGQDNTAPTIRTVALCAAVLLCTSLLTAQREAGPAASHLYPAWAASAKYNQALLVRDTDSALGRRSLQTNRLTLRDVALVHGHLCDGLVTSWVELGAALRKLFPDGVVDRTDVRVVSQNGPCWTDVAAWATGARINQRTLVLNNSVGDGFVVQRISDGSTVRVSLKQGVVPADLRDLERSIRVRRARGEQVQPEEIDRFETAANEFSRTLLSTPPETVVQLEWLEGFAFPTVSPNLFAPRSDVVNRNAARASPIGTASRKQTQVGCQPRREK